MAKPPPLKLGQILAYGLPAMPVAALALPFFIFVPTFYTKELGLPLASVGFALVFIRLFDGLNDPLIGLLCDRIRTGFGRRRTWFLAGIPITLLGAWQILVPGSSPSIGQLALWGLVLSIGWSMTFLPYSAWGAELTGSYRLRSRLSAARESFLVLGTMIAISLPLMASQSGGVDAPGLKAVALFICILLPSSAAVAIWRVPEPAEYSTKRVSLRQGLVLLRQNGPFIRLLSAFLLNGLANGLPATLFLLFTSYVLEAENMQGPLLFLYFLCGILSVPLWLVLSDWWGKHRTWCIAMLLALPFFLSVLLLEAGDVLGFAVICVLTGLTLGADLVLPSSIQADVIDIDTAQSGEQRSGLYFALWGLVTKISLALGVGIAFPLLELAEFDPQGTNAPFALLALTLLYSALPVALKAGAILLMWRFPLDEQKQSALRQKIEGSA